MDLSKGPVVAVVSGAGLMMTGLDMLTAKKASTRCVVDMQGLPLQGVEVMRKIFANAGSADLSSDTGRWISMRFPFVELLVRGESKRASPTTCAGLARGLGCRWDQASSSVSEGLNFS